MKKIILTLLIILLSITTTYATCDTVSNYKKTDTTISNGLIQTLINIGDKIVTKNPNKIDTYVNVLTRIGAKTTLRPRQKEIIGVLKEYFVCKEKICVVNNKIKPTFKNVHRAISDQNQISSEIGFKPNIDLLLPKGSGRTYDYDARLIEFDFPYNASMNTTDGVNPTLTALEYGTSDICTNGMYFHKVYVPKHMEQTGILTGISPNNSYVAFVHFVADGEPVTDFDMLNAKYAPTLSASEKIKALYEDKITLFTKMGPTSGFTVYDYETTKSGWFYIAVTQAADFVQDEPYDLRFQYTILYNVNFLHPITKQMKADILRTVPAGSTEPYERPMKIITRECSGSTSYMSIPENN